MKKILFTGGGTGGHVYPLIALIPDFEKAGFEIYYAGRKNSLEEKIAKESGVRFFSVNAIKFNREKSLNAIINNLKIPLELSKDVKAAVLMLENVKPDAVLSKGGFVSLPVTLAALKLRIPTFAHESDLSVGIANKIAKLKGATLLTAHDNQGGILVGLPIRQELLSGNRKQAVEKYGVHTRKPVVLVLGGSGGAKEINDAVDRLLPELTEKYFVIHVYGKNGNFAPKQAKDYLPIEFSNDMKNLYALSDVVVSRAGATAIAEIFALNKKAVLVPLSKKASRGDQILNANDAETKGATVIYENVEENLISAIEKAKKSRPLENDVSDTNGKIVKIICDSIASGELCRNKKRLQNGLL